MSMTLITPLRRHFKTLEPYILAKTQKTSYITSRNCKLSCRRQMDGSDHKMALSCMNMNDNKRQRFRTLLCPLISGEENAQVHRLTTR